MKKNVQDKLDLLDQLQLKINQQIGYAREAIFRESGDIPTPVIELNIPSVLSLRPSGKVEFIIPSGQKFSGKLNPTSNSFRLLHFMMTNNNMLHSSEKLAQSINKQRFSGESSPERRIRDTLKDIRTSLKLTKTKYNFYKVSKGSFGIFCEVNL